jgi:hypothetical protein
MSSRPPPSLTVRDESYVPRPLESRAPAARFFQALAATEPGQLPRAVVALKVEVTLRAHPAGAAPGTPTGHRLDAAATAGAGSLGFGPGAALVGEGE